MSITITEALAEIKTITKRLETKRQFVASNIARPAQIIDPFASEGGSVEKLRREMQAITDLTQRQVHLRRGIAKANESTTCTVCGKSATIAQWLTWRKEIAPGHKHFLSTILTNIRGIRGWKPTPQQISADGTPPQFTYNVDESAVTKELEHIEEVLGTLDGQLSLLNATTPIVES